MFKDSLVFSLGWRSPVGKEQLDEERNWLLSLVAVEKMAKKSLCVDVSDLQVETFLYA